MKSVIITKMHLLNFKGVRELTIEFGKDVTNILGRNGSGKTTIFDAFTWVLFGKDSADRKQFDIKTLDKGGVAIPRIPHEVSITLQVDGESVTLTRRYMEKWSKKRGSAVEEFAGHEEERIYNEVPCSLKEWNEKITAICPELVFKFITNPDYFTSQRWDAQRAMLFRMAGGVTNEEIAKGNEDFAALLSKLTGKTVEEYNREIGAKKKRIKAQIEEIPGRIDECNRTIAEHEADYPAIKKEVEEKKEALSRIDAQLADLTTGMQEAAAERQKVVEQHSQLGIQISRLEYQIISEVEKSYREAIKAREEIAAKMRDAESQIGIQTNLLSRAESELKSIKQQREICVAEYNAILAEQLQFSQTDFVCPTCGRPLELVDIEKKQEEMQERFNAQKAEKIEANKAKGSKVSKTIIAAKEAEIREINGKIEALRKMVADLQTELDAMPEPKMPDAQPTIKANGRWQELKKQEDELAAVIAQPLTNPAGDENRDELLEAKKMLQDALDTLKDTLAGEKVKANSEKRIAELETSMRTLSEELAELEGIEFTIAAFNKAKIEAVESKINSLFTMVRFRMYEQQINGGEVEKCEATIDGVPYSSANNASRINAGLDIINAICKYEGITAPIFVDNAESINALLPTQSQIIRLVVTEDASLVIQANK